MKKTCRTCEHACPALLTGMVHCNRTKETRKEEARACSKHTFDTDKLVFAFYSSLRKARDKHPEFIDAWPKAEDAEDYASYARIWKKEIANKDRCQLRDVLYFEVNEFLAEVARGDFDRALEEAGDIMAVLYRALNEDGKEELEDKQ